MSTLHHDPERRTYDVHFREVRSMAEVERVEASLTAAGAYAYSGHGSLATGERVYQVDTREPLDETRLVGDYHVAEAVER